MTAQRGQTFFKFHTSLHQSKPPSEPPWIIISMLRWCYVILKHRYRVDAMHAGDTNHPQTLLFSNVLALLSTTTTKHTFIPRQQTTQLAHKTTQSFRTQNHLTCTPMNHRVHSIFRILQHPPLRRPYITQSKIGSQKAWKLITTSLK